MHECFTNYYYMLFRFLATQIYIEHRWISEFQNNNLKQHILSKSILRLHLQQIHHQVTVTLIIDCVQRSFPILLCSACGNYE